MNSKFMLNKHDVWNYKINKRLFHKILKNCLEKINLKLKIKMVDHFYMILRINFQLFKDF